jgi:UDP-N-acetylglucosamine 2-epimerase (non-hydrolysing)
VLEQVTEHVLVHTGQNYDYELNEIFFKELGVPKPRHYLNAAGRNAAETIGNTIAKADLVLEKEQPEAVLVLGDTNSCLAVIPAKRRKIPVFHMEAGNRCFDMRVPEEINRRIVDHVSDINLCYTEHGRRYLLAEGLPPDRVMKTGSPMKEVIDFHRAAIDTSDVRRRLSVETGRYFTVSIHREENVDDPEHLGSLVEALNGLATEYKFPLIFSLHPRTRKRLEAGGLKLHKLVRTMPPLGFFDYVALQKDAFCTLSDSGTIAEEASILGFPAITVREAHERPEGMDEGVVIMSGLTKKRIVQAVEMTLAQFKHLGPSRLPPDYDVPQVSWKVAKIILGYTDYVNRRVWYKP